MSKSVGPTGCVWAFEPSPGNFQMLQYNLAQNGCTNVIAEQVAVSAKTEKVMLFHSNIHHGDHRIYDPGMDRYDVLSIQAVALDDYFVAKRSIDFIKMDIQGAEGLALAGMRKLIQGSPDLVILMEFWPEGIQKTGCLPERILIDFINDGFKVFDLDEKHASLNEITHVHDFVQSFVGPGYRNLIISRKAPKLKLV
jgi:FkbM family methyltransferase